MNVFHNISSKSIEKNNLIMSDILKVGNVVNYPLDWTMVSGLPTWENSDKTQRVKSKDFSDQEVNFGQMT